jgi:hypothetical protein
MNQISIIYTDDGWYRILFNGVTVFMGKNEKEIFKLFKEYKNKTGNENKQ